MICRKCQTSTPAVSEPAVCLCCGNTQDSGFAYCESCSSKLRFCQRCGESLRLSDFANVFACGQDGRKLPKAVERRIIAMMLDNNY